MYKVIMINQNSDIIIAVILTVTHNAMKHIASLHLAYTKLAIIMKSTYFSDLASFGSF